MNIDSTLADVKALLLILVGMKWYDGYVLDGAIKAPYLLYTYIYIYIYTHTHTHTHNEVFTGKMEQCLGFIFVLLYIRPIMYSHGVKDFWEEVILPRRKLRDDKHVGLWRM